MEGRAEGQKAKLNKMENVKVKKQSNLITQDELINVARDKMNEVGKFICTT